MDVVAGLARDARRTQIATWLMGLVVGTTTVGLLLTGRRNAKRGPAPARSSDWSRAA